MSTTDRVGSQRGVYLDYAATTPVDPGVVTAMTSCLTLEGTFGNSSSSTHEFGYEAAARIDRARVQVAQLIGAEPQEIVFTSGATESNNLTILGVARANADRGRHLITSKIEHKAVLDPFKRLEKEGFKVTWLSPDRHGRIAPESVLQALQPDTRLVSIMWVNNEIGVMQDIEAIGALCRERGVPFHTDSAQAIGKIPVDVCRLPVDLLSFTAHKLYGPKGIGALYVRGSARSLLQPITYGGGQERGLRPGTLPTHQIVGFGAACEIAWRALVEEPGRLQELRERLWNGLQRLGGLHLNGAGAPRVPGILNVSFEGVEGESLVAGLAGEIAVSTGSACNSASGDPSYVLRALGRDTQLAQGSLRFSVGRFTTTEDVDRAIEVVTVEVRRLRELSPASEPAAATASSGEMTAQDGSEAKPAIYEGAGEPERAGQITTSANTLRGEAGGPGQDAWVRFELQIDRDNVTAARFKAYGCPHTLKVVAWLAQTLPGRSRAQLLPGSPLDWAVSLSVPAERMGRLLVIEDALQACLRQWPRRE